MQVRRSTLADQVADQIVAKIESDGLVPGDILPAESELAREFGVNRLVVREAIRSLGSREILHSSQGRQARITVPSGRVLSQIIEFRLHQQSLDLSDLLATRALIETQLARLAADRVAAGTADTNGAGAALAEMDGLVGDRDAFVAQDVRFHAAIAEAAGSDLLGLLLDALGDVLLRARAATYDARQRSGRSHETTLTAHRQILTAVRAGDADAAETAMREHLARTAADVVETGTRSGHGAST